MFFYIYFTTFIICFLFRLLLHHFLFPLTTPAVFVVIESTKLVMRYVIIDWRKDLPIQIGFLVPPPPILFHLGCFRARFRQIFVAAIPYSASPRPRKDRDKTATDRLRRNDVTAIWRRTVSRAGRRATTKVLM